MLNVLLFIAVNWKVLRDFMHDREVYAYIQYKKELKCMYITYIYITFVYTCTYMPAAWYIYSI